MTKSYETSLRIDASPDRLLQVLTSDAFHVARDRVQGAIDVRVEALSRADERLSYEVHATRHARGLLGVDESRTEASVTTYHWDLSARSATWVFKGVHGDRVEVRGTIRIEPEGDGTVIHDLFVVSVKMPLVGGKVEDLVVKEMRTGFAKYEQVVRDHAEA